MALTRYAIECLERVEGLTLLGHPTQRGGVLSFVMEGTHPHDLATLLDQQGIAIRAGQHCAEPLVRKLGLQATARASFGLYTLTEEIDALSEGLKRARMMLS